VAGTRGRLVARQVSHIAPLVPQVAHFTAPSRLIYALFGARCRPRRWITPPPPPDPGVSPSGDGGTQAAGPVSPLLTLATPDHARTAIPAARTGQRSFAGRAGSPVRICRGPASCRRRRDAEVGDMAFVPRTVGTSLTSSGVSDLVILMWD
jgi:hypothetical protein